MVVRFVAFDFGVLGVREFTSGCRQGSNSATL